MPQGEWRNLAILYDKTSQFLPSNDIAIDRFCEAAIRANFYPTIISKDDLNCLPQYHGLLIRDTTHPGNYTYEFALQAQALGIKVLDNPTAISQGCNKIWQAHMFKTHNISHPNTWIDNYGMTPYYYEQKTFKDVSLPCVLKIPDSCFSQGVFKCNTMDEYKSKLKELRGINNTETANIVCQEFIQTSFDWRITIINHQFLFACKYWMVDKDWKIVKYDRKGNYISGNHECVSREEVPIHILAAADKCNQFLTDGLYGIDIKEHDGKAYVIEINDNPSIDGGVDDQLEGDKIYETIIAYFK